jgi:membrane protease subunit HflK
MIKARVGKLWVFVFVLLAAAAGSFAFYKVDAGEVAVVRTFGKETSKRGPGLHVRIPLVQQVDTVNVEKIRRLEVGFRAKQRIEDEARMLTGDENIVEAQMIVQYRVTDPSKFLFRLADPEGTLLATAEVALRSMAGKTKIDDVITTGRDQVQVETFAWLQKLMSDYQSGISITEVKLQSVDAPDQVKEAFHDVVRAREEKEKLINQAKGYQADLIPKARGEARTMERESEGYKEQRVLQAQGDAQKFESIRAEYTKARRVTRERLYLETMERVLGKVDRKVLVDGQLAKSAVPILPLAGVLPGGGGK